MNCIKIKLLRESAKLPTRGSVSAAGWDIYASIDEPVEIKPGETKIIPSGYSAEIPENTFAAIVARSGLSIKQGLAPANKIGIVDSDYRGEYLVALYNHSNEVRTVDPGDRVAQMIIMPFIPCDMLEVFELTETERGEGGLGSTGK